MPAAQLTHCGPAGQTDKKDHGEPTEPPHQSGQKVHRNCRSWCRGQNATGHLTQQSPESTAKPGANGHQHATERRRYSNHPNAEETKAAQYRSRTFQYVHPNPEIAASSMRRIEVRDLARVFVDLFWL